MNDLHPIAGPIFRAWRSERPHQEAAGGRSTVYRKKRWTVSVDLVQGITTANGAIKKATTASQSGGLDLISQGRTWFQDQIPHIGGNPQGTAASPARLPDPFGSLLMHGCILTKNPEGRQSR
jgi:hypothetical protein